MGSHLTKTRISSLLIRCFCVPLFFSAAVPAGQTTALKFIRTSGTDDRLSADFFNVETPGLFSMEARQGMVFDLSLDLTDDSSIFHFHRPIEQDLADGIGAWALP